MTGRPPRSPLFPYTPLFRSRTAAGRLELEIELVAVDVRHLGEALAERIEPDDVRIHLTQPHGHRVHPQLQLLLQFADLVRSEEHTSELQSQSNLVCRLLLEK